MNYQRVQRTLRHVRKVYGKILDGDYAIVIERAVANVKESKQTYDRERRNSIRLQKEPTPWGYTIAHNQPLQFKRKKVPNGPELQVDLYCDIRWTEDDIPVTQDIKVRVWSTEDSTIFRDEWDSQTILEKLVENSSQPRRVVSRFHLDRANPQQSGPKYHLQFGGKHHEYELCWYPEKVNVPRLQFPPMELFLTCQIIAANFFWEEYLEIREKAEWRSEILHYQNLLQKDYFRNCLYVIENNRFLLDELWVQS